MLALLIQLTLDLQLALDRFLEAIQHEAAQQAEEGEREAEGAHKAVAKAGAALVDGLSAERDTNGSQRRVAWGCRSGARARAGMLSAHACVQCTTPACGRASAQPAAHLMRMAQESTLNSRTSRPPSRLAATGARQISLLTSMFSSL